MKNGEIAAYCGNACLYLPGRFGGTGSVVVVTVLGGVLLVTAMSDRPRSGEFAFDLLLGGGPGLVG